ncbi:hypothetical protein F5Y15DRAFT_267925 [Xylariaceae sp. FL0016]|nr:hypothetical protein F5Y15DRAFT_267925 [Xylariaceae sp. FL0016]
MAKRRTAIGNKSIALRPKSRKAPPPKWKPTGPFRLFDLPPELRNQILEYAILNWGRHRDVLHVFLSCRGLYEAAAPMFYQEVLLDNTALKGAPDPFLTSTLTELSPRLHVRSISIRFCMEDQRRSFGSLYGNALRAMAERGNLRAIRLEIERRFPSEEFWGLADGRFCEDTVGIVSKALPHAEVSAPAFVVRPWFQGFLKFLAADNAGAEVSLYVDGWDHFDFWCMFHRKPEMGQPCWTSGAGKGKTDLEIDRKRLVKMFKGAQLGTPAG